MRFTRLRSSRFHIETITAATLFLTACSGSRARLNSLDSTPLLNFINSRTVTPGAYRILFLGDSLTLHHNIPGIWDHISGMAATSTRVDFVHLTTEHLQAGTSRPVEAFYDNGGNGRLPGMLAYYRAHLELKPDLLVIQGGENDTFDPAFRSLYLQILALSANRVILGDWYDDGKSAWEQGIARSQGIPFVDLRVIQRVPANSGYAGKFSLLQVATHPNDTGMQAIARQLEAAIDRLPPPLKP